MKLFEALLAAALALSSFAFAQAARADEYYADPTRIHVFSGNVMYCKGMDPRVQHATDCRTLKDRDFPVTCESPDYERKYYEDAADWNKAHPEGQIPTYRIFTLSIPDRVKISGGVKTTAVSTTQSAYLVNVYQNEHTGRIERFTVEAREPAQRPNPAGIKVYDDPRLPTPGPDGSYAARLSPNLKGKSTEEQATDFEWRLNNWLGRAQARSCSFVDEHSHALVYAVDPLQRNVDDFVNGCKDDAKFPCCSPEQDGNGRCKLNLAVGDSTAATNLGDVDKAISFTNAEFNLDMIQKMREGFLNTQAAILAGTARGVPGIDDFKLGPASKQVGKCDSSARPGREAVLSAAATKYAELFSNDKPELLKARRFAEWQSNRQTVVDVLETTWAECLNRHYAIWGGDDEARSHYYSVVNRNRLLGLIGKGGRADLYDTVKTQLQKSGLAGDFDFSIFEDRFRCSNPSAVAEWEKLTKKISALHPLDAAELDLARGTPGFETIMSPLGIGGKIRDAKRDSLKSLRKKLDKYGDECGNADELYKPHFILSDDGVDVWKDPGVVGAVVRDYTEAGRTAELKRFQYLYCRDVDVQASHDKWKKRIYIGLTAASFILPIAPAALPVTAGSIVLLADGLATASTAIGVGLSVRDAMEKYGAAELAQATYEAQLSGAENVDATRKEFYEAVIADGTSVLTSSFTFYRFAKYVGQSWRAGKALTQAEQAFYRYATDVIKQNKLSPDALRTLVRQCVDGDCTAAVRSLTRLTMLTPGSAKSADEVAALIADDLVDRRATLFPKFAEKFGSAAEANLPKYTGSGSMPFGRAYQRIMALFKNPASVYDHIQDLEAEVMTRSAVKGITRDQAFVEVLGEWEQKNGFKPAITLENRLYSQEEWRRMLRDGALFRDEAFADANRKQWALAHGAETHRIQWNIVMRDMAEHPELYASAAGASTPSAADLFKMLGSEELQASLDWTSSGFSALGGDSTFNSLWDELFDAPNRYANFTSPEFVRPTHDFWNAVGKWN